MIRERYSVPPCSHLPQKGNELYNMKGRIAHHFLMKNLTLCMCSARRAKRKHYQNSLLSEKSKDNAVIYEVSFLEACMFEDIMKEFMKYIREEKDNLAKSSVRMGHLTRTEIVVDRDEVIISTSDIILDRRIRNIVNKSDFKYIDLEEESPDEYIKERSNNI